MLDLDVPPVVAAYEWEGSYYVWCEYCSKYHCHGAEEGHRLAHCIKDDSPYHRRGYVLRLVGECLRSPEGRRKPLDDRFVRRIKTAWTTAELLETNLPGDWPDLPLPSRSISEDDLKALERIVIDYPCDTCKRPIRRVEDGFIQWTVAADYRTTLGLYVVHWKPSSPRGNCYVENTFYEDLRRPQVLDTHLSHVVHTCVTHPFDMTLEHIVHDYPTIKLLEAYPRVTRLVWRLRAEFSHIKTKRVPDISKRDGNGNGNSRFLIFKRDGYRCQICGRTAQDGARLEIDHKVPRSKGGTNDSSNLWTLCFECNRSKHAHDL